MSRSKTLNKYQKAAKNIPPQPEERQPEVFESPESSNILGAEYDPKSQWMQITFKSKSGEGRRYNYADVPQDLWDMFKTAGSKGGFFTTEIRDRYKGVPA